jgi:hypothetical protein
MSAILKVKDVELKLGFETQYSKKGRPFRLSGTKKNEAMPTRYIESLKGYRSHWIYTFVFLDEIGGVMEFEFDYYDQVCKITQ